MLLVSTLGVGCGPKEINYALTVVTQSCDPAIDPFAGVKYVQVRVYGDGLATPLTSTAVSDAGKLKIPQIPSGTHRVIEVRGYDGDPNASAKVISIGHSLPFEMFDVIPTALNGQPVKVNVFLRKVGVFNPITSLAANNQCTKLRIPRAGHTATLLNSGKVFIAGGYNQSGLFKTSLSDAEIFNPETNEFESAQDIAIRSTSGETKLPKAFHTATKLPNGQVLLWGGETYVQQNNMPTNIVAPNPNIGVYDETVDRYGPTRRDDPPSIPRSHHAAALDQNGNVVVIGGLTRNSTAGLIPAEQVEFFVGDPASADVNKYFVVAGVSYPRLGMAVAAMKQGEFIMSVGGAGGTMGTTLETDVTFFKYDPKSKTYTTPTFNNPPRLSDPGRRASGVAVLNDGADMMLLGGYSDATMVKPIASSEVVSTASATVAMGPSVGTRGDICAVTMADGTVLAVGGRTIDSANGPSRSDDSTVLIKPSASGGSTSVGGPNLETARYSHTCTLLQDGAVLITGGVSEQGSTVEILQDAWIYQPAPVAR